MCRWRDDKYHPVKAIERRKVPNADYEYYVHYSELNRRVDEWVRLEQLHLDSVEAVVDERMEEKGATDRLQHDTPQEEEDRSDTCRGTSGVSFLTSFCKSTRNLQK
ncbi:hypothetical protein VNO80_12884 [Phaseolus coccineus]|uniref:Chromo domain-containing protein n=1 Tax=Phaseolus coccineus TaxID=3886 RepID=A0AAN9RAY9_PHACN